MVLVPAEKAPVVRQILAELDNETVAWQQALALSEQLEAQDPSNVYYQFNQLVALYKLGRYEEARVIYERVADRLPSRMLWYQIEPILVYYRLGDYDRVLAMTDQILENGNYSFSELHQLRGLIFQERGQAALAQQSFDLATQFNSTSQIWMENLR
jgi:tetratricopeptide (TPR) repeat protein